MLSIPTSLISSRVQQTAAVFTPTDWNADAPQTIGATPFASALNTNAGAPIHTPIVGIVALVAVLLFLERRRLHLGGHR